MSSLHFNVAKLFKAVELRGDSMSPTYNDGDWLLFRLFPAKARVGKVKARVGNLIGKVVLIQRQSQVGTDFLQVKRVTQLTSNSNIAPNIGNEVKFWVEGDNKSASTDSRSWGALDSTQVIGKLIFRYRRAK
jgi:signal peptidase I